jgi:hypothetical protein
MDSVRGITMDNDIYVYLNQDGQPTLWIKRRVWHKFKANTPDNYERVMKEIINKDVTGACWWAMSEVEPEKVGYKLIGIIKGSGAVSESSR